MLKIGERSPSAIGQEFAIKRNLDPILPLITFNLFNVTFKVDCRHDAVTKLRSASWQGWIHVSLINHVSVAGKGG